MTEREWDLMLKKDSGDGRGAMLHTSIGIGVGYWVSLEANVVGYWVHGLVSL